MSRGAIIIIIIIIIQSRRCTEDIIIIIIIIIIVTDGTEIINQTLTWPSCSPIWHSRTPTSRLIRKLARQFSLNPETLNPKP